MCVIIASPAGARRPSKKVLETCNKANPDGMGFVYYAGGNPVSVICTDSKNFNEWYSYFAGVPADVDVAIHFRIATCGGISDANTHPFIGEKFSLAHNGQIWDVPYTDTLSDTNVYFETIKDMEVGIDLVVELFEAADGYSKFVVLHPEGSIIINRQLGVEDQFGNWYSNESFRAPKPRKEWDIFLNKYKGQEWKEDGLW